MGRRRDRISQIETTASDKRARRRGKQIPGDIRARHGEWRPTLRRKRTGRVVLKYEGFFEGTPLFLVRGIPVTSLATG